MYPALLALMQSIRYSQNTFLINNRSFCLEIHITLLQNISTEVADPIRDSRFQKIIIVFTPSRKRRKNGTICRFQNSKKNHQRFILKKINKTQMKNSISKQPTKKVSNHRKVQKLLNNLAILTSSQVNQPQNKKIVKKK